MPDSTVYVIAHIQRILARHREVAIDGQCALIVAAEEGETSRRNECGAEKR